MSAIHNKFMYESPYECKHNKLQLAKIQKYKITLQSSNFDILYLNNNRPIKNQTKTWRRKVNIHWKQWNKQWIAIQFPGLIPGISKIQEIEKEKKKLKTRREESQKGRKLGGKKGKFIH